MQNNVSTIKIQMITDHFTYKKGQIIELEEKQAINFLTNGKAIRIHRQANDAAIEKTKENSEEKSSDKTSKKSKKYDR